ncbi:MAG: hypothetical protein KAR42_09255 [candidate division Zixibacteria bacterium]|nr:hypothetical protein [candidate division Zixibacteria bacterium]
MNCRKIISNLFVAAFIIGIVAGLVACETSYDLGESRLPNAEQRELIRYYEDMKKIGLEGDRYNFIEMRDSVTHYIVVKYLMQIGRAVDSKKVSDWAYNWPNIAGLPIVDDSTDGEWRRIVFMRPSVYEENGREKTLYPIVLFRFDGEVWKVSNASTKKSYTTTIDGDSILFKDFTYHKMYNVPPDFSDLQQKPRDSAWYENQKPSGSVQPIKIDTLGRR